MKIISGGQTGADRAGLDFAIAKGLPHGGYCPKGRKAEDGPIPPCYNLEETDSADYPPRTEMNVIHSDATVVFTDGPIEDEKGCKLTVKLCQKNEKPYIAIDLSRAGIEDAGKFLKKLVKDHSIKVLNVAGSRASHAPNLALKVQRVLELAIVGE